MQNVLLIGMDFYTYEDAMVEKLSRHYHVYHFADKKDFFIDHFHIPVSETRRKKMITENQNRILHAVKDVRLDYVLVIVGRYLERSFLEELRRQNPDGVFILYLWDDVKRVENFEKVKDIYDRIITFDPTDAANHGFDFVPLMYIRREEKNCAPVYDLYSTMYLHTDREKIAGNIIKKYPELRCEVYLKCPLAVSVKKKFDKQRQDNGKGRIHYQKASVDYRKLIQDMQASKAILDIQFPSQIGLTMRTFDVMSVGRKLITTNPSIQYYDFYHPDNIAVIDREDPAIPNGFLDIPYVTVDDEILEKYSMDNWLKTVLEGKQMKYLTDGNPYGL